MHKPSLIAYSPYNHHIYTKIMIDPMYMQVSPAVVPLQMQQPLTAHMQYYLYNLHFMKIHILNTFITM